MSTPASISRQLALQQLVPFAHSLRAALSNAGVAEPDHMAVCQTRITARCCGCEARPSSEVLGALLVGTELAAGRPAEELGRLRHGYCLRTGCESRFYELTFVAHPAVDWAAVGTAAAQPSAATGAAHPTLAAMLWRKIWPAVRAQLTWNLAAVIALLLALIVWRQWWTGGSIPFFREARTFTSEGVGPEPVVDDDEPK
jgi:hypothetical protein